MRRRSGAEVLAACEAGDHVQRVLGLIHWHLRGDDSTAGHQPRYHAAKQDTLSPGPHAPDLAVVTSVAAQWKDAGMKQLDISSQQTPSQVADATGVSAARRSDTDSGRAQHADSNADGSAPGVLRRRS